MHDDVIKWKRFPCRWLFVRGIHRSPVNSPHKGQWRGALMFSLICIWINGWINNREAGDLRRYRARYDVIVMALLGQVTIYSLLFKVQGVVIPWMSYLPCYSDSDFDNRFRWCSRRQYYLEWGLLNLHHIFIINKHCILHNPPDKAQEWGDMCGVLCDIIQRSGASFTHSDQFILWYE